MIDILLAGNIADARRTLVFWSILNMHAIITYFTIKSSNKLLGLFCKNNFFGWRLFQSLAFSSNVGMKKHNFLNQANYKSTKRLFYKQNLFVNNNFSIGITRVTFLLFFLVTS